MIALAITKKKKYTLKEVKKIVGSLYTGEQASKIETVKLISIHYKLENEIYPKSNKEAKEYLSENMHEIYQILKKRMVGSNWR